MRNVNPFFFFFLTQHSLLHCIFCMELQWCREANRIREWNKPDVWVILGDIRCRRKFYYIKSHVNVPILNPAGWLLLLWKPKRGPHTFMAPKHHHYFVMSHFNESHAVLNLATRLRVLGRRSFSVGQTVLEHQCQTETFQTR